MLETGSMFRVSNSLLTNTGEGKLDFVRLFVRCLLTDRLGEYEKAEGSSEVTIESILPSWILFILSSIL